jgi:hypothetical protein
MAFNTPWRTTFGGVALPSYPVYDYLVREDASPTPEKYPTWARTNLTGELGRVIEAREALWETVLALWRLSRDEEEGPKGDIWPKYVSAWMVSPFRN